MEAEVGQCEVDRLEVEGRVRLDDVTTQLLVTKQGHLICGQAQVASLAPPDHALQLGQGNFRFSKGLPTGIRVAAAAGARPRLELHGASRQAVFSGTIHVFLEVELSECRFLPSGEMELPELESMAIREILGKMDSAPRLQVNAGRAVDVEGLVEHLVVSGETVSAGSSGLAAGTVGDVRKGAEIDQLDPYVLSDGDLQRLADTGRFTPRLRRSRSARKDAENAMTFGDPADERVRKRRAIRYWGRMTELLIEQQAPGDLVSNVRVAALRARLKGAETWRERLVLGAYSLVGYGERLLQPFLLYLLSVAATALLLGLVTEVVVDGRAEAVRYILGLALAPLSLFRVSLPPVEVEGEWAPFVLAAAGVVHAVLLGFMLVALRHTVQIRR